MNSSAWTALAQRVRDALAGPAPKKKTCAVAANYGLVLFLRGVADEANANGNETWCMTLRRAARGVAAAPFAVTSEAQAVRDVNGVGKTTSALLSTFWAVCPPEQDGGGAAGGASGGGAAGGTGAAGGEAPAAAAPRKRKAPSAKEPKVWEPKYKTANFALLVTLDRLKREGQATVSKATLVEAAEASQLSSDGIKPRAASTNAAAAAGAHGKRYTYDGWSGFQKYLASLLPGYAAPMVFTFGNPMNIRLTDEGAALALKLHRAAEARGDCRCGLVPPAVEGEPDSVERGTAAPASGFAGGGSGAARRSPMHHAEPPRPAPSRAPPPPMDDDDDCIIISDDDDAAPAPPPAKRPATQPAQKRARTPPRDASGAGGAAFSAKPLPQWRLSALNSDADHGVRLPPLPPGVPFGQEYDVVLLIDNREQFAHGVSGGRTEGAQEGLARLRQRGVAAELRTLCIGDALWVARSRRSPASEYCLDFVVERKRLDDLESSIKDARYKQQKYFLKRCGLRHPVYLLEGEPGAAGAITGAGAEWRTKAVKTAMLSTEVVDGFQVLRTPDAHGTFDAYGQLTDALRALYATLAGPPAAAAAAAQCPSFAAFAATVAAVRREAKTARALWGLMLTQVPGVGGEVAEAVLYEHPTPSALRDAYAAAQGRDARRALLAPLRTSTVKTVGPVLSARIYDWCTQAGGEAVL